FASLGAAPHRGRGGAKGVSRFAPIPQPPASLDVFTTRIARRYALMRRPLRQLHASTGEQCAAADEECIRTLMFKTCECSIDFTVGADIENPDFQPHRLRSGLHLL